MQAKVIKLTDDMITLEIESQLIFEVRYITEVGVPGLSPGDQVELRWSDVGAAEGVRITKLVSSEHRAVS
jgi:hypothetical protein